MLIAFDTSVLVAGALEDHLFHARAWIVPRLLGRAPTASGKVHHDGNGLQLVADFAEARLLGRDL
jgi:hypothetical protein